MNAIYDLNRNDFLIEVVSRGAFVDDDPNFDDCRFLVETTVIRLNHVAMDEEIRSSILNSRWTYQTEEEWENYKAEKEKKRRTWEAKIAAALNIDTTAGSLSITQSLSEIFTVVHMRRIPKKDLPKEETA